MSFEEFASTCSRTFAQTPIRLVRMSSSLTTFAGSLDPPYRHLVLLCQPQFTSNSFSVAFFLNGTAYFEYLNEEKIRQRLRLLNNPRRTTFHRGELEPVLTRLKSMLAVDAIKHDNAHNEFHAKLLSARLLSIELYQGDLKFKLRCEERPELFEQHYVRQLLIQVKELSQRQTYLCELLEHKDELPQFDSALFLSTPMTVIDDQEEAEEDDEILSSSTTGRLWRSAFGRRGGQQFLDICLLKKAYVKALDDLDDDDEQDAETVNDLLHSLVDQTVNEANEDLGLATRIGKRPINSVMEMENDVQQIKRLRHESIMPMVSV